jgi:hypothetical protein
VVTGRAGVQAVSTTAARPSRESGFMEWNPCFGAVGGA